MESYGNIINGPSTNTSELSTFNYPNYGSYDVLSSNYYNSQYLYYNNNNNNNNYGNYYQPPVNYGQYGYYPSTYNYTVDSISSSSVVDKNDSQVDTSSDSSVGSSVSSDYVSTVSPVPRINECTDQSTPVSCSSAPSQHNLSKFYPTPPTLDVSEVDNSNKKFIVQKSPDVAPRGDDDDDDESSSSRMKRRTRTQFSKYQIDSLEAIFHKNHYPDVQTVDNMSEKLGLAIERISVWFQNRRAKFKKTKKPSNFSAERLYNVSLI
jgi:hypothetical protein